MIARRYRIREGEAMAAHWYEPALTLRREIEREEPETAKRFIRGVLNCGSATQVEEYVNAWRKAWDARGSESEQNLHRISELTERRLSGGTQPPGTAVDTIAASDILRSATPSLRRMARRGAYRYRTH